MGTRTGVLHIALHEAARYVRGVDRHVLLLALAVGFLAVGAWPLLEDRGVRPEAGLYRAEADPDSPLLPVLHSGASFEVRPGFGGEFWNGRADLLALGPNVYYRDGTARSEAAARELELTARAWLDAALAREADQDAAFPVRVNLIYQPRALLVPLVETPQNEAPAEATAPAPEGAGGGPALLAAPGPKQLDLRPNQVDPPFPVRGLLLTFAYVVPLNFVGQFYAGSLLTERVRHRGVLLLSTPYTGAQILLGKSLPYVVFLVLLALVTTYLIGASVTGLLAVLPIVAFGLASTAVLGLLARNPRELTFYLVTTTVLLSTFLFLPAVFTQIHPVAFLSPVSVLVADLQGRAVAWGAFLYATLPLTFASVLLAALAVALYREETLFAPRGALSKLADAIHHVATGRAALLGLGALAVPFAIGLELFLLVFALALDLRVAFVVFLLGGAFVEEALKGFVAYAHLTRSPRTATPWATALLVGLGFFLGEKFALVFSLVGLDLLPLGPDALATFGISRVPLLVLAPLVLHVAATWITARAARRGGARPVAAWVAASLLHATYNTLILVLLTRGGAS